MSNVSRRFSSWSISISFILALMLPQVAIGANNAPTDSLISHWALDETSGVVAADSMGYQNGSLQGPTWRPGLGKIGGALEFDGVDDYVDLGTMDLPAGPGLTIAFWCKVDDFDIEDARFVAKATSLQPEDQWWLVSTINDGAIRFRLMTDGSTTTLFTQDDALPLGMWVHVVVTYDGTAMRIYKDGFEAASVAKTGTMNVGPAVPVAMGNQPNGDNPFDGQIDDMRIYNRALSQSEISTLSGVLGAPVIDVWYGDTQSFGHNGVPQTWANIVGRVPELGRVDTLFYTLNGGADSGLNMGPDGLRLESKGDFNIELDYDDLLSGANNLVISVVDTGGVQTNKAVTVNYTDGVSWAMPGTVDFEGAGKISDVAHVVDGRWDLVTDGVRVEPEAHGYDRLLVVGQKTWPTEYEVLVPITIHGSELGGRGAVGLAFGWQGHDGPNQPRDGHPYQAISFIRDVSTSPILALYDVINNGLRDTLIVKTSKSIQFDVTYLMRVRSEAIGGGQSQFSSKVWEEGTSEPPGWDLQRNFGTRPGSVLLISHRAEATFGNVDITPLSSFSQHVITTSTVGNGTVTLSPDLSVYDIGDTVIVSATADPGWTFDGWTAGLTGNANPDTIVVFSDSTITASFSQDQYTITTSTVGSGVVTIDPDQPLYVFGDTVVATAAPDSGWSFAGWTSGLSGTESPDTLVVTGNTVIEGTFTEGTYSIATGVTGNGSIQLAPDLATYVFGDTVIVTAVPSNGWVFEGWTGGLTGAENPDTVVVVSDSTITADFSQIGYTLLTSVTGSGSIDVDPTQPSYAYGDTVVMTALPDLHWELSAWSGDLTGSNNPDTLIITGDANVSAAFIPIVVSDDFHSTELDTSLWRLLDPRGDATLYVSGTNLVARVPGGSSRDLVGDCNCAPRILQDAPDGDFEIEAKFGGKGSTRYQGQGIIVQEDDDTYLRFEVVYRDPPSNPSLYVGFVDGASETTFISKGLPPGAEYIRVTRQGDFWIFHHSPNGTSFTSEPPFLQPMTVTEVGLDWVTLYDDPLIGEYGTKRFVGNADYFFNTASPIAPEDGGDPAAPTPPRIDVWQGDVQEVGHLGHPQKWANIVGEVWDTEPIQTLSYTLNGGPSIGLNMGRDAVNQGRLIRAGDFNIEIDYADLLTGANEIVITAVDTLGEQTNKTVTMNYTDGVTWAMPDTIRFESTTKISDEALVVDGNWHLVDGGVRTDTSATGYDRAIVAGSRDWPTEYEVLIPFTVHAVQQIPHAVGVAVGWQGHTGPEQPRLGHPYQAIAFVRDFTGTPDLQLLRVENDYNDIVQESRFTTVSIGRRYFLRVRSESTGGGSSHVSARVWEAPGNPPLQGESKDTDAKELASEPTDWTIEGNFASMNGSILLLAHHADVTFGDVIVTPLPSFPQITLTTNVVGNGTITRAPDKPGYADGEQVVLTANPASGWAFDGWSDGMTGLANPDSITLVGDTTVTATFIQTGFVISSSVNGNGSIVRSPDKPEYLPGDTIVVTAVPDTGWVFSQWSEGLTGSEDSDTIVIVSDTTLVADFGPVVTGIGDLPPVAAFTVRQNYPNPFAGTTQLEFGLPEASEVVFELYDVAGRRVYTDRIQGIAGWNGYVFTGLDRSGRRLPNGVYFYRVKAANAAAIRKMVILR